MSTDNINKPIPLNSRTLKAFDNFTFAQAQNLLSPDTDTFSTPPSTPTTLMSSSSSSASVNTGDAFEADALNRPSQGTRKRTSRPTSLYIDNSSGKRTQDLSQDDVSSPKNRSVNHTSSPVDVTMQNGHKNGALGHNNHQAASTFPMRNLFTLQGNSTLPNHLSQMPESHKKHSTSPKSPCFVHSHLDKGASLADWLRMRPDSGDVAVAKSLDNANGNDGRPGLVHRLSSGDFGISTPNESSSPSEFDDDDDGAGSVTRRLVETAVGVREMSKQLGRARVRSQIQNILIITKARDNRLIKLTREIALYLMKKPRYGSNRGLVVYVDNQLRSSKRFDAAGIERDFPELFDPLPRRRASTNSLSSMTSLQREDYQFAEEGQLRYWTSEMCSKSSHLFDFVVTLGGDGTVLFTSWLFQRIVPPVLPFALGSLGFLTNFDFADHVAVMDSAIDNGIRVNLRMRFTCTVYRAVAPHEDKRRRAVKKGETGEILMKNIEKEGWEALEGGWNGAFGNGNADKEKEFSPCGKDKEIMCFTTRPVESFEVLNDLVVDRGPSPYVSLLELFGDEHHMTTVQADGLTISTPTGSTAYSLSAGGSLVHPEIPAILITPICPHTLSFRPMLLPDSMELRICVPFNSRSTAWASFDGRGRVELKQGDHIKVTASKYPFPTVCADNQSTDWFNSISRTLKWNERERQKSFVVVEEGPAQPKRRKEKPQYVGSKLKPEAVNEAEEEDEVSDEGEEEEEEGFDIDDSSPEASLHAPPPDESTKKVAAEKARQMTQPSARDAAIALSKGTPRPLRPRSISRTRSGIDSPDRFAGPHPHPPTLSPRHVQWAEDRLTADGSSVHAAQNGDRDHIHSPQLLSGAKSRIPKDRDVDADSMKTPTIADGLRGHHQRANSREYDGSQRRAFAVWGQDESDSNTSDSDI